MKSEAEQVLRVGEYEFPLDRYYCSYRNSHLWVRLLDDGSAEIGVDAFLSETAGRLSYLSVSSEKLERGKSFATIESAKFVSRLPAPVSGEVVELNAEVLTNPARINESPYDAWILRLRLSSEDELEDEHMLRDAEEIRAWIEREIERLEEE